MDPAARDVNNLSSTASSRAPDASASPDATGAQDTGAEQQLNSDQIRARIAKTRADMDETVDAIQHKLDADVKHLTDQFMDTAMQYTRQYSRTAVRVIEDNPVPLILIGAGLGWLAVSLATQQTSRRRARRWDRRHETAGYSAYGGSGESIAPEARDAGQDFEEQGKGMLRNLGSKISSAASSVSSSVKHAAQSVTQKAKDATDSSRSSLEQGGDAARGTAEQTRMTMKEKAQQVKHRSTELSRQAREKAHRAQQSAIDYYDEHPLMIGAAACAIGIIAGLAIPLTRKERQTLGPVGDRAMERVKEVGREAVERGKRAAEAAIETVKQEVHETDVKLNAPGEMLEKGKQIAQRAGEAASREAQK